MTALALVVLACWGVVLVTRGRVRRAVAALGVLAAARRPWSPRSRPTARSPDQLRDELGRGRRDRRRTSATPRGTGWPSLAAVLALVAAVLAVRLGAGAGPRWARRYDAPGARGADAGRPVPRSRPASTCGRRWTRATTRPPESLNRLRAQQTRTATPREEPRMSDNHGNTPAAWTAVVGRPARLRGRRGRADARPDQLAGLLGRRRARPSRPLVVFAVMAKLGFHQSPRATDRPAVTATAPAPADQARRRAEPAGSGCWRRSLTIGGLAAGHGWRCTSATRTARVAGASARARRSGSGARAAAACGRSTT